MARPVEHEVREHRPKTIDQRQVDIAVADGVDPLGGIRRSEEQACGLKDRALAGVVGADHETHGREVLEHQPGDAAVRDQQDLL